jgi:predicted GIY-YIG superfamily endonuclease
MPSKIVDKIGFQYDKAINVKGRLSISDLFPKSKKRCGIYLLNFSDDTFYIGQAIDVVKRFSQHRKSYENVRNIVRFWFIEVKKEELNIVEEKLIKSAAREGLLITNKTFVSNIIGDTDLDSIIDTIEQNQWLEDGKNISNEGFDLYSTIDIQYKIKYQHNFEKLKNNENYAQIQRILKQYIEKCIPAYKKTEHSFWSLSCMPSTNGGTYPRYFCMNINAMEVFVLGYDKKEKRFFGFINITTKFLDKVDAKKVIEELYEKYSELEIEESNYRAAGEDQICLSFYDLDNFDQFERFFRTEGKIIDSIKEMNLRLMRKGGTIYSPYHCFELANDVLKI